MAATGTDGSGGPIVERLDGGVGLIRLNRPERRNALDTPSLEAVRAAADAFDRDAAVGCIVITGDERAFAAGSDVTEMEGAGVADMLASPRAAAWAGLRALQTPTVAAVRGYALGGGLELAMLCDMIVAGDDARLGQPEVGLGIMPGAGGTQRLTRQLGKALAMEVVLAGRLLGAEEAREHGLVNRVVPSRDTLDVALELARKVAARPAVARRVARTAVLLAQDVPLEQGLAFERHAFALLFGTEDRREGLRAFLEKRTPTWKGR